ncbi:MAG: curlin [Pseudomonadota bacterium]
MKLLKITAATLIAASLALPLTTQAHAGGTISFGFNAKNEDEANAVKTGLFIYKLVKNKKGNAVVDQNGNGNAAGIAQDGSGHTGVVHQDGDGHTGTVTQCGNNNSFGLFQFGKNANGNVAQCGNGEAGAMVQIGF